MTDRRPFDNPVLLGFDRLEQLLDRFSRTANDGYPPYNIERFGNRRLRITIAVAGFALSELSVTIAGRELSIVGQKAGLQVREFLHRGIAAREFRRTFLLAHDVVVEGAALADGLLSIELAQPVAESVVRTIEIRDRDTDL